MKYPEIYLQALAVELVDAVINDIERAEHLAFELYLLAKKENEELNS